MSIRCKVQIVLSDLSGSKARAVKNALVPDNVSFPEGLSLEITDSGSTLVIEFDAQDSMRPLISSIDEVLEHATLSLRVIK